jgi:hypothetical protein
MTTTTNTIGKSTIAAKISAVVDIVLAANNIGTDERPAFGKFFRDNLAALTGWRGNFPKPAKGQKDRTTECPEALVVQLSDYLLDEAIALVADMVKDDRTHNVPASKDGNMILRPADMADITAEPSTEELTAAWNAASASGTGAPAAAYERKAAAFSFDPNLSV